MTGGSRWETEPGGGSRRAPARASYVRAAVIVSAATLAAGCGGSSSGSTETAAIARRDSAGLTIVEIPRGVLDALDTRRIATSPRFTVGAAAGREQEMFGAVSDATLMPDGRLAVADAQKRRIVVFGTDGALDRVIGAPGSGAGEFESLYRIAVIGDTLFVPDLGLFRMQAFTTDGELLGERTIAGRIGVQIGIEPHRPGRWTAPHVYRVLPEGFPSEVDEGDGPHRVLQTMMRYDTLGGRIVDLRETASGRLVKLSRDELQTATRAGVSPFPVSSVLPHPLAEKYHGAFLIDQSVIGWSGVSEVEILTPAGELERIIRFDAARGDVSPREDRFGEWAVSLHEPSTRPIQRRAWNVLPRPEPIATFYDLRTGPGGDLWIAVGPEEVERRAPLWTRWLRLDADGTPVEWVLTPPLEIIELGPEALLAFEKDDNRVERVAVHAYETAP